jgi:hypothetical protein
MWDFLFSPFRGCYQNSSYYANRLFLKNKCEVECTPFLSLLCLWRLNGLRAGQPGLDSRQEQDKVVISFGSVLRLYKGVCGPESDSWSEGGWLLMVTSLPEQRRAFRLV